MMFIFFFNLVLNCPKNFILNTELYLWIFCKKCFELTEFTKNDDNGSSDGRYSIFNLT